MSNDIIQFSHLGRYGDFGNQLFQYTFMRAYAEKYDYELQIPPWIGEKIFKDVVHSSCSKRLPIVKEKDLHGQTNVDVLGFFQDTKSHSILSTSKIKKWLQFQDKWLNFASVKVAAHLRRGDFLDHKERYCLITRQSYLSACKKYNLDNPTWVHQKNKDHKNDKDFDNLINDFLIMVNAKVLLRSNSSFSFWAGFFNKNKVYSPVVEDLIGWHHVEFRADNYAKRNARCGEHIFGD